MSAPKVPPAWLAQAPLFHTLYHLTYGHPDNCSNDGGKSE
jgi:hypothetical protein